MALLEQGLYQPTEVTTRSVPVFVTPAKAGVQNAWIPACAGMTEGNWGKATSRDLSLLVLMLYFSASC
jgi:hypothetical protein